MKGDMVGQFSERAWNIGKPGKSGWVRVGAKSESKVVEVEKIPIVKSEIESDEEVVVEEVAQEEAEKVEEATQEEIDDDLYPTNDEIREFLTKKGVKFHPKTGTLKLRAKYDENKK